MANPIFVIDDFSSGISYDETENISNGFNDISNIDLKNINGVAMLGEEFVSNSDNFLWANNSVSWQLNSYDTTAIHTFVQRLYPTGGNQIYAYNGSGFSVFMNTVGGVEAPTYGELATFQNSLVYSSGISDIGTCYGWTSGMVSSIGVTNGSPTITLSTSLTQQLFSKRQVGGLIYLWNGTAYISYTISAFVSTSSLTLSTNYAGSTTTTHGYSYTFDSIGVTNESGTHTTLTLPIKTNKYRPFIDFNSKLYVGDGEMICSLDSTLTNWKTTNGDGAISLGYGYTAKQIVQIGNYMYILADNINSYNNNSVGYDVLDPNSKLYIWDGTSVGFNQIIDIGTQCFCIRVAENRIYALLKSNKGDGALFTYFNGSDFPTIGKIQLTNIACPISNLSYDRGRFYILANGVDKDGVTICAMYSYSAYAIEKPCMFKNYQITNGVLYGISFTQNNNTADRELLISINNNDGTGGGYHTQRRNLNRYLAQGIIQTQKYEITTEQFGQLVKGIQVNFKETMYSCTVDLWYKGDENTNFIQLGTLTPTNQNDVLYGINDRFKKIMLNIVLKSTNSSYTPKIVKISLY